MVHVVSKPRIAILLLVAVGGIAALSLWSLRGDDPATLVKPTSDATPLEVMADESPEGALRRSGIAGRGEEVDLGDCAFFEPWRSRALSAEGALELFASIRPLRSAPLECISGPWLMVGLALACEGRLELAPAERELLAAEAQGRLGEGSEADELLRALRGAAPAPTGVVACVLEDLLPPSVSQEERARLLGRWLVALFGERGDFERPDAELVRFLQQMMAGWPITEDAWWEGLHEGIAAVDGFGAVKVRVALYDALRAVLPEGTWVLRLQHLASLEDAQGTFGGFSLMTLGFCLQRHLSEQHFLSLLGAPANDAWRVGLMLVFPDELGWPNERHAEVPGTAIQALLEMRDSGNPQSRLDVLQYQWRILGPEHAVADLERFVLHTEPSEGSGWTAEATYQIRGAVEALSTAGVTERDRPSLDSAGMLVRKFFVSAPPELAARVLESLRSTHWNNVDPERQRRLRSALVELLGDEGLTLLRPDLADWLRS